MWSLMKSIRLALEGASLKIRVIIPLVFAGLLLLGIFVLGVNWYQQRHVAEQAANLPKQFEKLFAVRLKTDAESLSMALNALQLDDKLRAAFREKNRDAILNRAQPLFETLRSRSNVTHMYFTGPDRVNLLRVHQPARHGDRIDRITTLEAEKTGKLYYGIELGPLGTFTLRVVSPWYDENRQLLGFVELGKEIGEIVHEMQEVLDAEFIVEIDKRYINRQAWEESMKMLGRDSIWGDPAQPTIIYHSTGVVPSALAPILAQADRNARGKMLELTLAGRHYCGNFLPLLDAGGRRVGQILPLLDVSELRVDARRMLLLVGWMVLGVGAVLFLIFYNIAERVQRQLESARRSLIEENQAKEALRSLHVEEVKRKHALLIRAQSEIVKLNAELEQRVIERTQQLEAANKELETFSHSVSHDLRAPLRSINGFSQMLRKKYSDTLDETGREYLDQIRLASQGMGELIDDLLALSRVTRMEIKKVPIDLSWLVQSILGAIQKSMPRSDVECIVQPDVNVNGDLRLLKIVMENFLGNAWKFTSKQPAAKIEFGAMEKEGEKILYVRDNGAGFNMKYAGKMFGAFQRLHSSTEFEGTGIGLATVQRIINRHGGRVWAEGEEGKGATFYFTL